MKASELKTLIKEACKEAFREEMKEILLEAVKSPKTIVQEGKKESRHVVNENQDIPKTPNEIKNAYMGLMSNMMQEKYTL
jgi:vacuolar-type H+-ATPase subunit E/Vma4